MTYQEFIDSKKISDIPTGLTNVDKLNDTLFEMEASTLQERQKVRRNSIADRVDKVVEIIKKEPNEQWLIWCDMNAESELLRKKINNSVEVKGSDNDEHKKNSLINFANNDIKILVTKPKIAGMGMNFQSCHNMVFTGLSDSYEQFYQAVRRCWRFGQTKDVNCYIVTADTEGAVVSNIARKEKDSELMIDEMVKNCQNVIKSKNNSLLGD